MIRMIYEDIEDDDDYDDFNDFANKRLDDYHLPLSLLCAIEYSDKTATKYLSYDKLQDLALEWNIEVTAEHEEKCGI